MTTYELTYFKKMVQVWKTKSQLICLRYDPLIILRRKNHVTFIFIKTMSHDLLVQMAYLFQTVTLKTVRQASYSVFAIVKSMVLLLQSVKIVTFFWKMYINLMAFVCTFFFWLTDVKCSSVLKVFLNIHAVWAWS